MNTKIYYIMDTMYGWCYGFSGDTANQNMQKYMRFMILASYLEECG